MSNPRYWRVRQGLSAPARRRVRRVVDAALGRPLGSVAGARRAPATVGLTFDDGPDPAVTDRLLDALRAEAVQATFFVLVDAAEAEPDLVRRMAAEGHEVGLHGLDHRRLTRLPGAAIGPHLRAGRDRLATVTGVAPRWFRPPFGGQNLRAFVEARRAGLEVVVWSADGQDWVDRPAGEVAARATDRCRPGGIVLLHEVTRSEPGAEPLAPTTFDPVEVARLTVDGLRRRGLEPTSVGQLVDTGGIRRTVWFRP